MKTGLRRLSTVCLAMLCTAAGGSSPDYTLIVGPRVDLGPVQGIASNLAYAPVSGVIGDLNGDGAPDIVVGINGGPPVVYLNNGTADPFANVAPVDIPATAQSGYGRSIAVGALVRNGNPNVLIVDGSLVSSGQSGAASYYLTTLDQNPRRAGRSRGMRHQQIHLDQCARK
jgi:hypothetical protein